MSPLVPLAIAWLLGLCCAPWVDLGFYAAPAAVVGLATGIALAVWGLLPAGPPGARPWMIWLLCGTAFATGALNRAPPQTASAPPRAGMVRIEADVLEVSHGDGSARAVLRVRRGEYLADGARLAPNSLLSAGPTALPEGARVRVMGKLRAHVPFRNPSPHPPAPPRHELTGKLWIPSQDAVVVLEQAAFARALDRARAHVRARLIATLPPRVAGIARALVLGDARAVQEADREAVRAAGLAHLFAVSGLHVTLLAGMCVSVLQHLLLRVPYFAARYEARRIAAACGVPLALSYAAFAGGAPSAWRAAITAAIGFALVTAGARPQAGAVAAAAAATLGALAPDQATRPGFLLSIVATAAILTGPMLATTDLRGFVRAGLVISARTTLATAPIVLWCFGSVPLIGLLANVVLVPIGSALLVPLAAAHALLCQLLPRASPSAELLSLVARAFVGACDAFARLAPQTLWPPPTIAQGLVLALASAGLLLSRSTRRRLAIGGSALLLVLGLEWQLRRSELPEGRLRVTFFDVGQGDAALIDLPDGRAMLIDAGGSPNGGIDPGRAAVLPVLRARRRSRIDYAVLSHPHPDHYGGLSALLDELEVGEIWDSGQADDEADLSPTSAETSALLAAARGRGIPVRKPDSLCGTQMRAAEATIQVLSPCPRYDSGYDENDNSLVLRLDYRGRSVLFTGDAERHAEAQLLQGGAELAADILKVGHHGSRTSSTAAFLRAVDAELAIVSAGAQNPFGHPHVEVRQRLHEHAGRVLELAHSGGVVAETDGGRWRVRAWSGQELAL